MHAAEVALILLCFEAYNNDYHLKCHTIDSNTVGPQHYINAIDICNHCMRGRALVQYLFVTLGTEVESMAMHPTEVSHKHALLLAAMSGVPAHSKI